MCIIGCDLSRVEIIKNLSVPVSLSIYSVIPSIVLQPVDMLNYREL